MNSVSSRTPRFVRIGALIGVLFLALPIVGLLKRVAWSTLWGQLSDVATRDALRISLYASVSATLLALVLGLPLAWCWSQLLGNIGDTKLVHHFACQFSRSVALHATHG